MVLLPFPTTYFDALLFFISRKCGINCLGIGMIRLDVSVLGVPVILQLFPFSS